MANPKKSDSRGVILDRLRSRLVDSVPLPELKGTNSIGDSAIKFDDPVKQFGETVALVGGKCVEVTCIRDAKHALQGDVVFSMARTTVSLIGSDFAGSLDMKHVDDPHDLSHVDYTLAEAEFGVAENGALWITDKNIRHRVILFITQHLALFVRRSEIVNNMHEAYERIGNPGPGFGVFISGPSKTADIEQSLVLGAHGCRSLTVYIVD